MWVFMRFRRSLSFEGVKFLSLELTALNLLPSMELYCFPKRLGWSQSRFYCRDTCFRALVFCFLKSVMVRTSGVSFWHSYMTSRFLVVSLAIFLAGSYFVVVGVCV
jgi:hypothetical protein